MSEYRLPAIRTLRTLPNADLAAVLDHLFEPCVPLHTLSIGLLRDRQFESYEDCVANVGIQLTRLAESASATDTQWLESILVAHPRLGEKKVESAQSRLEQSKLAPTSEQDQSILAQLNATYENTFPRLRYV